MWYNFDNSFSSSILQKEHSRYLDIPRIMNPVRSPLQKQRSKDGVTPSMLSEYPSTLHTFSDPSVFIDFALDSLLATVDAAAGSFFVWDEYSKELVLKAARGTSRGQMQGTTIKLRDGVAGRVVEKGFPILVKDIRTDDRFKAIKSNHQYHSFSFLVLPLTASNKLVGLINITEKESHEPFTNEDLERAQSFASHIAIAYENIRIQSHLRKENQELSQTVLDLREKIKQEESLVSLGKLSSHLAHELANPLDAIRRFVNLALDQVVQDTLAREYLLKAKKGIRRSVQVIRGLLELSIATTKNRRSRKTELHSLIEQTIANVHQGPSFGQIVIEKQFCGTPLFVEDYGLATVFQNLIQNANHAMNGIGKITIATEITNGNGKQAIVTVRDSGHGVPETIKAHIFEPFFTTKDNGQGTGIGLTICREIIQRCGGQITFESSENQGTEFIITIPCQA